ncbi:MAG: FeoB-associated Cys-rich membrane protein [Oscillospiraceae bacterium]|nr:FeoB-associated Cys-rich membrane protein [Oscillospiraceae bacterium]
MQEFITENIGTIIAGGVVIALLAWAVVYLLRKKKRGGCAGCDCNGACEGCKRD